MKDEKYGEQIKLWRLPHLRKVDLLHASYVNQSFSRHMHEGFAIGVIEEGALKFSYRGENLVASFGHINLANPGEAHDGHAASKKGWTYRMFYLDSALLQEIASQVAGKPKDIPYFQMGVIQDDNMAGLIRNLHLTLEKPCTPALEQESLFLWTLAQFVMRYADDRSSICPVGKENQAINRVREYINAYYGENISIKQLSLIANLSPFHLIRVFRKEVGVPPHTYLSQIRVQRAKKLLAQGLPISQVTFETGFADQSHLTKQFKRIIGVTPGKYSKIIQDLSGSKF